MLRAVVLSARLEFTIEEPILDAIRTHRHEIARSAPARLMEEFYKILRSGHAEDAMRQLRETGLMKVITSELAAAPDALWQSIAALDRYRRRFTAAPEALTNAILAGTLLQPMGPAAAAEVHRRSARAPHRPRDAAGAAPGRRAAPAGDGDSAAPARSPGAAAGAAGTAAAFRPRRSIDVARRPRRPS